MKYLIGIIGIIVFLGLAWLASNGKKKNQNPADRRHARLAD